MQRFAPQSRGIDTYFSFEWEVWFTWGTLSRTYRWRYGVKGLDHWFWRVWEGEQPCEESLPLTPRGSVLHGCGIRQHCGDCLVCSIIHSQQFAMHDKRCTGQTLGCDKEELKWHKRSDTGSCIHFNAESDCLFLVPVMWETNAWVDVWQPIHSASLSSGNMAASDIALPNF